MSTGGRTRTRPSSIAATRRRSCKSSLFLREPDLKSCPARGSRPRVANPNLLRVLHLKWRWSCLLLTLLLGLLLLGLLLLTLELLDWMDLLLRPQQW